ncbi:MAG: hypothetical protein CL440_07000 [Acidimicrobiaceae bacterium]|nr:hypothetical protein [Acidimicrobiaceae bacterium]|tara:strand:- start:8219 stop:8464 length:246 start_codon:yes stop_codon:yes gene_type:complete
MKAIHGAWKKVDRIMSIPVHEDLILTIRVKQDHDMDEVRQIVFDNAHDLHLELERAQLPSTVVVCSGDGIKDKVIEKFANG